ncbi:TolC family outer membrane protein [Candidatus Symbiobacter mobilis]|uniref:Outer membrane channel protein TolC n=1 Tax=Candidatus Symbiobacter mobilis CR TaxID=946483 RepID=U5NER8_9BURK|nr:TolC family outer membrane protein [Candidatus Symbiobacter mobilis]AGX88659.1 outer membrane channel protein TolC [Candidatus Symbiobacter mobilis CR]
MKWFSSLTLVATAAFSVHAADLTTAYNLAKAHDPAYRAARATHDANVAQGAQAQSAVLPSVQLTYGANRTNVSSDVAAFDRGGYGARTATLSASQPLYRPANVATARQGELQQELAQTQWQAATQDLLVRVSQAYFDVLAAQDSLALVQAQKKAVAEQLSSAQRNFDVGTATITDTREAQARFDLVIAQEIAAENALRIRQIALDKLTGTADTTVQPLSPQATLPAIAPADMGVWVDTARSTHPTVRQAQWGLEIAQLEHRKATAADLPTLDLTGSYSVTRNDGSTQTAQDYRNNVTYVGLQAQWPVFAGFSIRNRIQETVSLEEKAQADLQSALIGVEQATRTAYLGLQAGMSQVRALEAAQTSGQSALDATRTGYEVGVRVNVDVLNAQSVLFDTQTKLSQARYDVLLGHLRLRQANGSLQESDLDAINALLAKP